jgi:16S rRNA (adenine1518-N6/adenine1519-N6)-dimethyltransferase
MVKGQKYNSTNLLFSPNKKLGQNFLFDSEYLQKIVENCPITPDTVIIEIGSGYGSLTNFLAETDCQKVISYEKDKRLFDWLVANNQKKDKITYLNEDALLINWSKIRAEYQNNSLLVVGNLPYYLANSLIVELLFSYQLFQSWTFLVQKEVGQKWVASPNKYSSNYSALSVLINFLTDASIIFNVPASAFTPPSAVDGAVVVMKIRSLTDIGQTQLTAFFRFLKNCFRSRRKTLWNNLMNFAGNCEKSWDNYFRIHNYQKKIRPQELNSLEYWKLFTYWQSERDK